MLTLMSILLRWKGSMIMEGGEVESGNTAKQVEVGTRLAAVW